MGYSRGIFLPKHLEGHLLSAGTLFVMKLNPESTVGQFVCAPRQEDREKGIVLSGVLPRGAPFLHLFPSQAELDPVPTSLSILSQLQTNNEGDREQMEKLEAAAVAQSHSEWHRRQNLSPALTL